MALPATIWMLCLLLLAAGGACLTGSATVVSSLKRLPRSRSVAFGAMLVGGGWFLYHVFNLGEADFGAYRWIIFGIAVFVGILSFKQAPDFLAIRGLVIVYLLAADVFLDSGFMRYEPGLLFCKAVVYLGIALSLWLAISPFRARDAIEWLTQGGKVVRLRAAGAALLALGLACGLVASGFRA
jgi:hypothetical protein